MQTVEKLRNFFFLRGHKLFPELVFFVALLDHTVRNQASALPYSSTFLLHLIKLIRSVRK
jgi:hypothetical protein